VCVSQAARVRHAHVIEQPDTTEAGRLKRTILNDAARGAGVAVLDPGGRLVNQLLTMFAPGDAHRVVYFRPGERDWVPLWNPLEAAWEHGHRYMCDAFVSSLRNFTSHWSDRVESLMRMLFGVIVCVPRSTVRDMLALLKRIRYGSARLRRAQLAGLQDRHFRQCCWDGLRDLRDAYEPTQAVLEALLRSGSTGIMLSQPNNRFRFQQLIDAGYILLIDLSLLEPELRVVIGRLAHKLLDLAIRGHSVRMDRSLLELPSCGTEPQSYVSPTFGCPIEPRRRGLSPTQAIDEYELRWEIARRIRDATHAAMMTRCHDQGQVSCDRGSRAREDLCSPRESGPHASGGRQVAPLRSASSSEGFPSISRDQIVWWCHERYYRRSTEVQAALQRTRRSG
jgi:hypothetical protein